MRVPLLSLLASRAERAEATLRSLRRLHRADDLGSFCLHCGETQEWPCATFQILDGA